MAGKPDLASPEETGTPVSPQHDSVILQDLLTCGSVRDLTFSEQLTSVENPQAEADLQAQEKEILLKFLILCSRCRITQYCSVSCQRKESDFQRFSCGLVAKGSSA